MKLRKKLNNITLLLTINLLLLVAASGLMVHFYLQFEMVSKNVDEKFELLKKEIEGKVYAVTQSSQAGDVSSELAQVSSQIRKQNNALKKQLRDIESRIDPASALSEPKKLTEINTSKKKRFLMKMKLNRYFKQNNRFPESVKEFKKAIGRVPREDTSKSSRVSLDKDHKGGWYYDMYKGIVEPNVR